MTPQQKRTRLIAHHMVLTAIPAGSGNPLGAGAAFLTDPAKMMEAYRAGAAFVDEAVRLVKTAPDNPFRDDDAIISHLLAEVEKRKESRLAELLAQSLEKTGGCRSD